MTTSPPPNGPSSTSVFNTLGSYADRIKDANAKPTSSPAALVPAVAASSSGSKGPSPAPRPSRSTPTVSQPSATSAKQEMTEEGGLWETVQTGRQKGRPEEKKSGANSSKNWRERPQKEVKEKEKAEQREEGGKGKGKAKKGSSPSSAPGPSSDKPYVTRSSVGPASSSTNKPAWGLPNPAPVAQSNASSPSISPTVMQTSQTRKGSQTVPPSPSINGTTSTSVPDSVASPNLSAETASTTTVATSVITRNEDQEEGSWRTVSKDPSEDASEITSNASRPVAPPPAVNPWDIRKKAISASVQPAASVLPLNGAPKPGQAAPVLHFGSVPGIPSSQLRNGGARHDEHNFDGRRKKRTPEAAPAVAVLADTTAWPDVATAAEVAKKDEEKKEKAKEKKNSEEGSVADEAVAAGKKTKWTAIPASELLAAADEIAETQRRAVATRKRLAKAESSTSVPAPAKGKPRKNSVERAKVQQSAGENRLPPIPPTSGTVRGEAPVFKPVFGSLLNGPDSADSKDEPTTRSPPARRMSQASVSRPDGSPSRHRASLPTSPSARDFDSTSFTTPTGLGPFSKPMTGSATAPVTQAPFQPTGSGAHSLPRVPRGRDARGSFPARGRGGFRSQSNHVKGFTSPVMGPNGLPDPNNLYARGFGMGYNSGFYPPQSQLQGFQNGAPNGFDLQAGFAGMYGRPALPPPPMPHTHVPNIDPLRFYVLGQVEYYFSMQNLAMDFFLRQQMDSEGWIDIPMIASFNRLKSLSSDVALVKEVMQLSSLLEVREEKVRLVGEGSKRWVLPDAKLSTMPADPNPPVASQTNGEATDNGQSEEHSEQASDMALAMQGLGIEDAPIAVPKYAPGDVEIALMKSVPPSSSASILNGDNEVEGDGLGTTPATSMSGDKEDEEGENGI